MKVNAKEILFDGNLSFADIGDMWQKESPNHDGGGLSMEFTDEELMAFTRVCGVYIGAGIANLLSTSIRRNGFKPNFTYTKEGKNFITKSNNLPPGEFGRCADCGTELKLVTSDAEKLYCPNGCN